MSAPRAAAFLLAAWSLSAAAQVDPRGRSVLFIRGADCTGGATEGGPCPQRTEQLSDVDNVSTGPGNHGFGWLKSLLHTDGFFVTQLVESASPLTLDILLPHRAVVLGSNNKVYAAGEVAAFHAYIDAGGSALFISDANWGLTWEAAPASDNQFLARYGAGVYQDSGQIPTMARAEPGRYLLPGHPLLSGPDGEGGLSDVDAYNGEGVSLFRILPGSGGYQAIPVVSAAGLQVRLNNPAGGPGPAQPAGPGDAAMIAVERGASRIAGHFDRNTFFNLNGAGTDLTRLHNARLALNVFRFLVSVPAEATPVGTGCGTRGPVTLAADRPVLGTMQTWRLSGAAPLAPGYLLVAPGPPSPRPYPNGCVLQVPDAGLAALPAPLTDPQGSWTMALPLPETHLASGLLLAAQAATLVAGGPMLGIAELSNGLLLRLGDPR